MTNYSTVSAVVWFWGITLAAAEWPHWRGPDRDDTARERSGWADGRWVDPRPQWTTNVGDGSTSPIVAGGRVYTMGWRNGADRIVCLDPATGKEVWAQSYPCPKYGRHATGDEPFYFGPSSTPAFDGESGLLYTLSLDGDLCCWDTRRDGAGQWRLNLYDQYGVGQRPRVRRSDRRDYGFTTSPLVWHDWVIVEVGADEGTLMAFSKRTGERRWTSECKDPAGHTAAPVLMNIETVPCVAVLTLRNLLVARLDPGHEGKTVALYPWETDYAQNIPTPAVQGDQLLITSRYNHESIVRLDISLRGASPVWEQPYASGVCSPVIREGRVYWVTHQVMCLDFETGRMIWQGGRFGDAGSCILTQDEKLIAWGGSGTLALIDLSGQSAGYRELARIDVPSQGDVWPHVVLAGGRIYCKDRHGQLHCFRVRRSP
jgi:outer membrane protein assembly factor BamB